MADYKLYRLEGTKVEAVEEHPFKLESSLQKLIEQNLQLLLGTEYIRSEMTVQDLRLDTLAFDRDSNAFVIIEFKSGSNYSIIDQGYAYLAMMLNNKAEFVLEYNQRMKASCAKNDFDWSQSRVYFVAPAFTRHQLGAVQYKDLPMSLFQVNRYCDGHLILKQIEPSAASASVKDIALGGVPESTTTEVEVYSLDTVVQGNWPETRMMAEELAELMTSAWPEAEVVYKKLWYYFRLPHGLRLLEVVPQKKGLKVYVQPPPEGLPKSAFVFKDASGVGRWTTGRSETLVVDSSQMSDLILLLKAMQFAGSKAQ